MEMLVSDEIHSYRLLEILYN